MENDCSTCDGRGEIRESYEPHRICYECLGTGQVLTAKQRRFAEGIVKMLSVRLGRGFE